MYTQRVGKMAIVKTVLETERASRLYFDKSNIYNQMSVRDFENTWIVKFIRMLNRGLRIDKNEDLFNNVAFIVFNYDRCLEHFLIHAVQQLYSIPEDAAARILRKVTIIHPYGMAAPFKSYDNPSGFPFGGEAHILQGNYWAFSEGIRTYNEQITSGTELKKIHNEMINAERIVFLGFAFHDQNMALLKPEVGLEHKQIFATAKGMSDNDVGLVRAQLTTFFSDQIRPLAHYLGQSIQIRSDLTCAQLFDSYNKSLPA
jgi:hypothetical protein